MSYFGKRCVEHPELSGERYNDGHCIACTKERVRGKISDRRYNAAWNKANPDKVRAYKEAWRNANPQKRVVSSAKWRGANRHKLNAYDAAREAHKRMAAFVGDPEFNSLVFAEAYTLSRQRAVSTGVLWHVDHVVPLRSPVVCGLHTACNIAVIPARDNQAKGNRYWPEMP